MDLPQANYIRGYLAGLPSVTVVEEPSYFDKDYLSEFASFYSTSARSYPNICRRWHFFSGASISRDTLRRFAAGQKKTLRRLQECYVGFSVIRPIPSAPFGKTVLKWYPDQDLDTPRVTNPSRPYHVHLLGQELTVTGLAWQQQDVAVAACATVGLWTMFQSSAFDENHAIPTTAEITKKANLGFSAGRRIFPSRSLTWEQISEAIKACDLSPLVIDGDIETNHSGRGFSKKLFATTCAAFIRSGYPVLMLGHILGGGGHATVAVGFRSRLSDKVALPNVVPQDSSINVIYVNEDNVGPYVRTEIGFVDEVDQREDQRVCLRDRPPAYAQNAAAIGYEFVPRQLICGVHNDLRMGHDQLLGYAEWLAGVFSQVLEVASSARGVQYDGPLFSARFVRLADYLGQGLKELLSDVPAVLSKVRLGLVEHVRPMPLYIGLIRIGLSDSHSSVLADILLDTTDTDHSPTTALALVSYLPLVSASFRQWAIPIVDAF
ncbi:MAG: hypothetical protein H5U26_03310 [Immundisolibacter sp.]|uniref:hypothetical protein n=1 Tax=Immundisolibacter sp. TaxID=1934948 RepID=UPI00198C8713|nr:hypothetical protein [Immundisolibacter sp.]MBC7161125.1 hypothetical protein [Immundisolibacter sp.]